MQLGVLNICIIATRKTKEKIENDIEIIKNNVYVGPSYSNDEIKSFLDTNKINFKIS